MDHRRQLKLFFWVFSVALSLKSTICQEEVPSSTTATEGVARRGFVRFHANDSHVGQPVPCTRDEKVCLRHNLVFHPKSDRCQPLGEGGHGCNLRVSRQEFEHGSGHIVGVCQKYDDPCSYGLRHRMAYDGRCYDQQVVYDTLCGSDSTLSFHFLGGMECRNDSSPLVHVEQPEEEGRCLIPDFRERRPPAPAYFDHPLTTAERPVVSLNCSSAKQRGCFQQEKVWVEGASGCHSLLKRGPCPPDHVVVIDGRAAAERRAEATCMHVRGGCPEGHKRMAFDGECHADRDIALAAPGVVHMNAYGVHEVLNYAVSVLYTPQTSGDKCEVEFLQFWPPIGEREDLEPPPCGPEDMSQCSLLEVLSEFLPT
ncbi:hypothetical protein R5R35_005442 [Gryllus longicercus]|uniref:Accessory gland protein n=1 Tax=Gryllus longicercus TaxID=2509291 RepID=A0AAN9VXX7_9ORTH